MGIAYFVLTYRMPNGDRNIPLSDAFNAIKTVRDSSSVWNINPYDVGIMGFSAGGHLASTVSTHAPWESRPDFSILFYPVISMKESDTHKGSVIGFLGDARSDEKLVNEYSNDRQVRCHTTPPAIILLANDDRAVPPVTNGVAYYSAMRNQGNECSMFIYPSGGHGFGFRSSFKYHDQMISDLTTWLKNLKSPQKDAIRVACIGNSITEGSGIPMSSQFGYPAQLQKIMGNNYHVKNFGVGAQTLLNKGDNPYMKRPEWKGVLSFNPNIVVIKLGTNDTKPQNWQFNKEFQHDLLEMIEKLQKLPANPRILLAHPIRAFKSTWDINDNIIVNELIPIINQVAKKKKLQVIDLHEAITDEKMLLDDGIHPNEKGAQRIAEVVAEAIRQ
jgi:lysophospholipase L1-like esterase